MELSREEQIEVFFGDRNALSGTLDNAGRLYAVAEAMMKDWPPSVFQVKKASWQEWKSAESFHEVINDCVYVRFKPKQVMCFIDVYGTAYEFPPPLTEEPEDGTLVWVSFQDNRSPICYRKNNEACKLLLTQNRLHWTENGRDCHEAACYAMSDIFLNEPMEK